MLQGFMNDTSGGASLEGVLMIAFLLGSCGGIAMTVVNSLAGNVSPPADTVGDTNRAIAAHRAGDPHAIARLRAGDAAVNGAQSRGYETQGTIR